MYFFKFILILVILDLLILLMICYRRFINILLWVILKNLILKIFFIYFIFDGIILFVFEIFISFEKLSCVVYGDGI